MMRLGKSAKLTLLAAWLGFITWLFVMPIPPGLSLGFDYEDKLVHLLLFSVLVYLLIEAVESFYILKYRYVILASVLLSTAYAQFIEIIQGVIGYRSRDVWDALAGLLGSLLAAGAIYWLDYYKQKKPKLLLHICCIGCGVSLIDKLSEKFDVYLFFYNPNIFPRQEYKKRLSEIRRVAKLYRLNVIISRATHRRWKKLIKGRESDPERGGRCTICYRYRMTKTALRAKRLGFDAFTTTLSISPHKNYPVIKKIGEELAQHTGIAFLDEDFKKNGGFQRSCEISKKLNLYRQDYCGCEFSIRK
jgi:predicted adenine nucleotide alpha hydrolase (AANH) superfamily ATPase/VanZ family protein